MNKKITMSKDVKSLMKSKRSRCACLKLCETSGEYMCVGLDVTECLGEGCSHYKSNAQNDLEQIKRQERFNMLPNSTLQYINEKYKMTIRKDGKA